MVEGYKPLAYFNKCVTLYYGANNSNFVHAECGQVLLIANIISGLGVICSINLCNNEYCNYLPSHINFTSTLITCTLVSCDIFSSLVFC